jgi:hypothetical protein
VTGVGRTVLAIGGRPSCGLRLASLDGVLRWDGLAWAKEQAATSASLLGLGCDGAGRAWGAGAGGAIVRRDP